MGWRRDLGPYTYSDASFSSGRPGIYLDGTTPRVDDFEAGEVSAGTVYDVSASVAGISSVSASAEKIAGGTVYDVSASVAGSSSVTASAEKISGGTIYEVAASITGTSSVSAAAEKISGGAVYDVSGSIEGVSTVTVYFPPPAAPAEFCRPVFLVSIGHSSGPFYASSAIALSYDSKTWARLDADVNAFTQGLDGAASARIVFPKYPGPLAAMVARDELRGQAVNIYKGYLDSRGALDGTPVLLLAGRFDYGSVDSSNVTLNIAEGAAARRGRAPRQRITPPVFNHAPKPQEKLWFNGVPTTLTPEGSY